jgi:hypothetical protein
MNPPMSLASHCFIALALEVAAAPERASVPRDAAEALARWVAIDLARLVPEAQGLDLALVGAHFDPAELLRPGWPLHATLDELARRAPPAPAARIIAFGMHEDALPLPALTPEPALFGGPLRLVPLSLRGNPELMHTVAALLEARLLDTGMAGASTALFAQDAFAARIEHARYLTVNDLCAMTAMQYEHAGLAPLWPVLEAALFESDDALWLDAAPEPLLRYVQREVRLARPVPAAWQAAGLSPAAVNADDMARAFAAHNARSRQFAAVLGAHGVATRWIDVAAGEDARSALQA